MRSHLIGRIVTQHQPIEPLVRRTIDHEPGAWQELWLVLDPRIETIARRWRVTGRLASSIDERREVVLRVMDSLHADDFRRLGKLHAALLQGEEAGRAWISLVVRREAVSHLRGHPEYLRGGAGDGGSRWAALVPLPEGGEELAPASLRTIPAVEAHELLAYAEEHLRPQQLQMLRLWLAGYEMEEIVTRVGAANQRAAGNLLYRALENLRYRFAGQSAP